MGQNQGMEPQVTDAMVEAAWSAAFEVGIEAPFMARVADFLGDLEGLRAADLEAERQNDEAMRAVLVAALKAGGTA